jgi:hypothetical protein
MQCSKRLARGYGKSIETCLKTTDHLQNVKFYSVSSIFFSFTHKHLFTWGKITLFTEWQGSVRINGGKIAANIFANDTRL